MFKIYFFKMKKIKKIKLFTVPFPSILVHLLFDPLQLQEQLNLVAKQGTTV